MILICGPIGSGKSVVSRILREMGHDVFDCDYEARLLMDSSPAVARLVREEITPKGVRPDGSLDRRKIAETVFADPEKLARLNETVHTMVHREIERRKALHEDIFVETAIPVVSGLAALADGIWLVRSDHELRRKRVAERSGLSFEEFESRHRSQMAEYAALEEGSKQGIYNLQIISNTPSGSLLHEIESLLIP